jgi:HlyD family secretion protein/epimerase transport system membrane fusion protein
MAADFAIARVLHGRRKPLPPKDVADTDFLDARHLIKRGSATVVILLCGFFIWAAVAPLSSATMAPGVVVVESHRKAIQHLEGGIVREVLVEDGDRVKQGQVLVRLDDAQARASLDLLQGEADALTAEEARLTAERDGTDRVAFPPDLLARLSDPKIAEAVHGEEGAFKNRRETLAKQAAILTARTLQNTKTIDGLKAQQDALETQLTLIEKESTMIKKLVDKGIEAMPRLLALQRADADLSGQHGQVIEKMAQVQVNSGETQLQIVNLRNQFLADVLKDLRDVQTRRFDLQDRVHSARDVVNRLDLTAPVEGRVVGLSVHTPGAVIRPGDTLLEIVPDHDELEVEAHIRPEDANEVLAGAPAKVTLSAYKQRRLPIIVGNVISVSADRLTDERTGQPYFIARVSVNADAWKDYPEVRFTPGMPVEVAVETGSQTALDYFLAPIQDVMRRGMREK